MPRLLLVDDNESIHKIAETLLAPTDIQLVCAKSAKDAIQLLEHEDAFDAALFDTSMAEMDGWALLEHFRKVPATRNLPIAMMAGVLDTIDPNLIAKAPIQGFLKKPVEFRDLSERIYKLMGQSPKAPHSTMSVSIPEAVAKPTFETTMKSNNSPVPDQNTAGLEDLETDLLVLTSEDLIEENLPIGTRTEDISPFIEPPHIEETLELEDLDLEGLKDLAPIPPIQDSPVMPSGILNPVASQTDSKMEQRENAITEFQEFGPEELTISATDLSAIDSMEMQEFKAEGKFSESSSGFDEAVQDLGSDTFQTPSSSTNTTEEPHYSITASVKVDPEDTFSGLSTEATFPQEPMFGAASFSGMSDETLIISPEEMTVPARSISSADLEMHSPVTIEPQQINAQEIVNTIIADPVLVDQLAKALVARLGDETLREIAWEVMPDLLERLQRQ